MSSSRWRLGLAVVVAGLFGHAGCDSFGQYCEDATNCRAGNEADREACAAQLEEAEELASLLGCDEWFDARQECREEQSRCENSVYAPPANECNAQERDLASCQGFN